MAHYKTTGGSAKRKRKRAGHKIRASGSSVELSALAETALPDVWWVG
jgi:hypothetical protein